MRSIMLAIVALACTVGCDANQNLSRPLAKGATLDMHVVSASPAPGSKRAIDPATNAPIFLTMPAIISAADVATIRRSSDASGAPSLTVSLTPTGASKVAAATAKPAGMQVAIVVNGTLVSTPQVRSPLSAEFLVVGEGTYENRDRIFATLTDN